LCQRCDQICVLEQRLSEVSVQGKLLLETLACRRVEFSQQVQETIRAFNIAHVIVQIWFSSRHVVPRSISFFRRSMARRIWVSAVPSGMPS
jgi:hypothetical protein